jgi:hypothetical protein
VTALGRERPKRKAFLAPRDHARHDLSKTGSKTLGTEVCSQAGMDEEKSLVSMLQGRKAKEDDLTGLKSW